MNNFVSQRTNASQLFNLEELKAILDQEAKRSIFEEKRKLKLIDYTLAEEWLRQINVKINPFLNQNDTKTITENGNLVKENLATLTLKNNNMSVLFNKIADYLSQENPLEKSDFIFVFGGKNIGRIQKAVKLWKAGWAPKIWISGGHPVYQEYEPEALTFKKWAVNNGVFEESILIEPDSITIADNVRRSLNKMDDMKIKFNKMILIISWYAQKRAWMTMEKYLPAGSKLINVNAIMEKDNQVSPTEWYKSEYGINIVFNEFLKMRINDSLVMNNMI